VLSVSLLAGAIAQSTPGFIHVDEIRPGMKGYGLSVFRGTVPERFDVEVIDVLHNFRPNQDLILIRTPHPLLDRARGVAGMSGSPIYLEGRLAGAYAYGWGYGSDPVVGVTPIANMLAELKRPVRLDMFPGARALPSGPRAESTERPPSKERFAGLPPFRGEHQVSALSTIRALQKQQAGMQAPAGLHRATTPIMLGGLHDSVAQMLAKELEPLGFMATQSSVGGSSKGGPKRFEPGGAVAVELARGDISMVGIGTVTYVGKDGRTLAFGHPMMEAGATGLPTATARVLHVLVSEFRSFKIAEAGQPLGALVQDRQPAIVIDPDIEPARIPVRVKVNGVEGAPKTEWHVDVASHRILTPTIVFAVIANAVKSTAADVTDVVFRARSKIAIEGHGVVSLDEQGFSPMGAASPTVFSQLRMFGLMEAAFANAFESSRVTSIDLELDLEQSREVFQVSDASVAYDEVDPGEEVTIYVRLRRVDQPDTIRAEGRCRSDCPGASGRGQQNRTRAAATRFAQRPDRTNPTALSRNLVGGGPSNAHARPSLRGTCSRFTSRLGVELAATREHDWRQQAVRHAIADGDQAATSRGGRHQPYAARPRGRARAASRRVTKR